LQAENDISRPYSAQTHWGADSAFHTLEVDFGVLAWEGKKQWCARIVKWIEIWEGQGK